jgi:hypothetical protein
MTEGKGGMVSREDVNKILYDGYQRHLHDCVNSARAAEFVHGLQRAVTALPSVPAPSDTEQLLSLRAAAEKADQWFNDHFAEIPCTIPIGPVTDALRHALKGKENRNGELE